jgi:molecular chaperone Hsp33
MVLGFSGDGPLSRVFAEADEKGAVRGTVSEPRLDLPTSDPSELGVGRALGDGILQILRHEKGVTHQSLVEVVRGRIGKALTQHLHENEETRSAVLLGVLALPEGVAAAGGMLLEARPSLEPAALDDLEERLLRLGSVSRAISAGGLATLVDMVLPGTELCQAESSEVRYVCRCGRRRIHQYLSGLQAGELEELRTDSGMLEVECVFCGSRYFFEPTDFGPDRVN